MRLPLAAIDAAAMMMRLFTGITIAMIVKRRFHCRCLRRDAYAAYRRRHFPPAATSPDIYAADALTASREAFYILLGQVTSPMPAA